MKMKSCKFHKVVYDVCNNIMHLCAYYLDNSNHMCNAYYYL